MQVATFQTRCFIPYDISLQQDVGMHTFKSYFDVFVFDVWQALTYCLPFEIYFAYDAIYLVLKQSSQKETAI